MGIGRISVDDLSDFVTECDALGGIADPRVAKYVADFTLSYRSAINETLDPFGDEYFRQQMALYREIAGRDIDQSTGELMPLDVPTHAASANPYNTADLSFMTKHVRSVATAMLIAKLPPNADVLDIGSGWGLSSEVIAFCGATVTSVDINPLFVDLASQRAKRLNLPIDARQGNFDHFEIDKKFDVAFFYECLHHALRPWVVVENAGRHLKEGGKIVFSGEPVYPYWKNWGLRLDAVSIYCIRKFGWFESGWSAEFIIAAFSRAGFKLELVPHVGLENGPVGIAHRTNERAVFDLGVAAPSSSLRVATRHRLLQWIRGGRK
ncbi:class I SAM-dependent methyltransferase [Rhizobium cauense]|uniref:class I SAM-dependent methyltransferase n=1 Tax=Rhizobium cauense TaxID=1166683 RepID=UPI001C6F3BFD|nr:class I SAM-dependent methyltransferase [Rhizobium cauense]MBW9114858.1 class I SAM-dependent methyltransferase [Rhizobium cauense]